LNRPHYGSRNEFGTFYGSTSSAVDDDGHVEKLAD
jgi:hypothetical protein